MFTTTTTDHTTPRGAAMAAAAGAQDAYRNDMRLELLLVVLNGR